MKQIAKILADLALFAAKTTTCSASVWNLFQPEEPAILREKEQEDNHTCE